MAANSMWAKANRAQLRPYHVEYRRQCADKFLAKRRSEIDGMANHYIRQIIINGNPNLTHNCIPQPLVDAHREALKIKRYIRENSK